MENFEWQKHISKFECQMEKNVASKTLVVEMGWDWWGEVGKTFLCHVVFRGDPSKIQKVMSKFLSTRLLYLLILYIPRQ